MGMTPQQFHIIPTSCAILPPLTQICFVFITYNTKYVLLSAFFHHVAAPYPDSRICKHFITHGCKLGSQCRFLHCTPEELASQMAHEQQQGQGPPRRPNGGPPPPHHREPQSAEHMDTSGSTLASNEPQT